MKSEVDKAICVVFVLISVGTKKVIPITSRRMSDISFEEQIRLEEEERKRKSEEAEAAKAEADEFGRVFSADGQTYTDKDGCLFEWVADKNAADGLGRRMFRAL